MEALGIIGFGNMGRAFVDGLLRSHEGIEILVCESDAAKQDILRKEYRARQNGRAWVIGEGARDSGSRGKGGSAGADSKAGGLTSRRARAGAPLLQAIVLAVKPQDIPAVPRLYPELFDGVGDANPDQPPSNAGGEKPPHQQTREAQGRTPDQPPTNYPIISIAAGVSLAQLSLHFPGRRVIRFMPSLAAQVGKSVTAIAYSEQCTAEDRESAVLLAQSVGIALEVREELIPAIIGIAGSGIAFVYECIHALALGGVSEGLTYKASLEAVLNTMEGAAASIRGSSLSPSELVTRVCSPGGTTIEGIKSLHSDRLTASLMDAVSASAERSRELEKGE